jgi:hypothetical protein
MIAECILVPQERLLYDSTHHCTLRKFRVVARRTASVEITIMREVRTRGRSSKKYFCCYVRSNFCNSSITNFGTTRQLSAVHPVVFFTKIQLTKKRIFIVELTVLH